MVPAPRHRHPTHTSTTAQAWVPARGPPLVQEKVLVDSVPGWRWLLELLGEQARALAWSWLGNSLPTHPTAPELPEEYSEGYCWYPNDSQGTSCPAIGCGDEAFLPTPACPACLGRDALWQPTGRAARLPRAGGSGGDTWKSSAGGGKLRQGRAGMHPHTWCQQRDSRASFSCYSPSRGHSSMSAHR